jgi:hypothetical protein
LHRPGNEANGNDIIHAPPTRAGTHRKMTKVGIPDAPGWLVKNRHDRYNRYADSTFALPRMQAHAAALISTTNRAAAHDCGVFRSSKPCQTRRLSASGD